MLRFPLVQTQSTTAESIKMPDPIWGRGQTIFTVFPGSGRRSNLLYDPSHRRPTARTFLTAAFQVAANAPGETLAPEILKIPIYELSTTVLTLFLLLGEACFKSVMRGECASAGAGGRRSEILKLANIPVGGILRREKNSFIRALSD
jgi:hypothetical protein